MADVVDHPLSDEELCQLRQAPGRERQAMILRSRQRNLLDLLTLRQRELCWSATRVLRRERVEPVTVEVVDDLTNPVLGRERDLRDRRHIHCLRGPQHDLCSPPANHRPRPTSHHLPLDRRQVPHLHTFSHPPMKTDPTDQMVDATPATLPVTARADHGSRRVWTPDLIPADEVAAGVP
jgi:hypothetical protein